MSSKYVPPHLRGQGSDNNSNGNDRGSGGYNDDDRSNDRDSSKADRFDSMRDNDSRGGKNGKGKGKRDNGQRSDRRDNGDRQKSKSAFAGKGGDWHNRSSRRERDQKTEIEVFGEVKTRSTAGIDFDKYDAIPVQVTGEDVTDLKPITRFSDAKLADSLFDNLRRCGYDRPTPVQKYSIPIVTSGRDLMACAQTGSGKTCAFMVPCLESLLRSGPPSYEGNRNKPLPCGLVLAPTRELASQIHGESNKFSFETGIRCCIVYGGADMREQRMDLERGCDILIATPGRLTDMVERHNVSLELVQFFILDEADRMLDMGFEPQVRQIVEGTNLGKKSDHRRQSMMFSATFPREVQFMARDFMEEYVFITVGRVGSTSGLVTQRVLYAEDVKQKAHSLAKILRDELPKDGLAVVFVETKRAADSLELDLHESGVSVTAIHGDRTQTEREEALHAFKTGANPVLVATDVAARGLDIPNVGIVVNFDMPRQIDDYVHRVGRTGRAGRKGTAIAFVNSRCAYLPELGDLLLEAKQELPIWFTELCAKTARPGGGAKARGNRFGGQDLRMNEGGTAGESKAVATPIRNTLSSAPARPANSFGNTGQDDAW